MQTTETFSFSTVPVIDRRVVSAFLRPASVRANQRACSIALDPHKALESIRGFAVVVSDAGESRGAFIFEEVPATSTWNVHCALRTFGSRTNIAFLGALAEARRRGADTFCAFFSSSNRTVQSILERNGFLDNATTTTPEWADSPWVFAPFN